MGESKYGNLQPSMSVAPGCLLFLLFWMGVMYFFYWDPLATGCHLARHLALLVGVEWLKAPCAMLCDSAA